MAAVRGQVKKRSTIPVPQVRSTPACPRPAQRHAAIVRGRRGKAGIARCGAGGQAQLWCEEVGSGVAGAEPHARMSAKVNQSKQD